MLSPLEILLLNYRELAEDQELLESLDYVTLMNLCQSSTSLRERCRAPDIQTLLKKKERESAFIILRNLQFILDTEFKINMTIQYPKLLEIGFPVLKFKTGVPGRIKGNTINSDIESLANREPFGRVSTSKVTDLGYAYDYYAVYSPEREVVLVSGKGFSFKFSTPLYHRILVSLLELYNLEYAIAVEGGESGQQEIYIHV